MFFWPHSGAYNGALSEEMVEGISDSALFTQPRLRGHFLKVQWKLCRSTGALEVVKLWKKAPIFWSGYESPTLTEMQAMSPIWFFFTTETPPGVATSMLVTKPEKGSWICKAGASEFGQNWTWTSEMKKTHQNHSFFYGFSNPFQFFAEFQRTKPGNKGTIWKLCRSSGALEVVKLW